MTVVIVGCFLWTLVLLLPPWLHAQTPPHLPRIGANLLLNAAFNGESDWYVTSPAVYDAAESRTGGTGSIRVPFNGRLDNRISVAVTGGKTYTFAAYIKTTQWPPPALSMSFYYAPCGSNSFLAEGAETGRSSPSRPGVWEEIAMSITPSSNACVIVTLGRFHNEPSNQAGNLWIDEIYVGEGLGFGSPPAARVPFVGQNMEVDALGNIRVRRDGVWEDFFPLCIYGNSNRPNYLQYYSDQGFNCDGRSGGNAALVAAKNATSTYNPKGIMIVADVGNHLYQCDGCWGWDAAHSQLGTYINEHKNSAAADRQLWWYDDNEVNFVPWQQKMDSMLYLQAQDRTVVTTGTRLHPMFMLQGNWNMTRSYRTDPGGVNGPDIAGTYSDGTNSGGAGGAGGFDMIIYLQNQVLPAVIVNANIVHSSAPAGGLRASLYKFLGRGVRAWTMWMDCYPPTNCEGAANRLEEVPWLPDVGPLRQELDALLPLLRQPHWTSWSVSHNGGSQVHVGTRDSAAPVLGHLIIVNDNTTSKTVTFTVSGLGYTMNSIKDFFTGATRATPSGNQFTLTLDPVRINTSGVLGNNAGSAVVKLDGAGGGDAFPTVTINTTPTTTTATSLLIEGTATDDIGVASVGIACSPSCGTPVVSCTPPCSPTATSVNWSATVPLSMGVNVITVTATDSTAKTTQGQVSIARVLPCQERVRWRLDEGSPATITDDTGTANADGTLVGGPTWVTGRSGPYALSLNGTSQYVENSALVWPAGQPATVEVWINTSGGTPNGTFNIGGTENRLGCHIPWSDNTVYCDFNDNNSVGRVQADFASHLNVWTHVAFTADTASRKIYLNGVLAGETNLTAAVLPELVGFEVGRYDIQPLATYYHTGQIDDARLYTCVRSAAEILAAYQVTDVTPPVLTILTASGSTALTPVAVHGTATDDVGVTGLSVSCSPGCGSPVVTCTPTCGGTATSVDWSASVPLQTGANVITVTASDAVPHTVNQQVTITLSPVTATVNQTAPLGQIR